MTGLRDAAYCVAAMCLIVGGGRAVMRSATGAAPPTVAQPVAATSSGAISLHADRSGHYTTTALVNGRVVSMMVDTGATLCAFGQADAESLGLTVAPGDFKKVVMTANGPVRVAPIRIRLLQIGPVAVRDVEAVVIPRGLLGTNLLGMSFLSRLRDFSVAGARITLRG
ncbi:retropepsin-like aspartic protease family protein [Methylobacterium haplocladii]|uniref:retropepsin-like aspartic protease family protein n=1 Tax=Methylobacterium haplocladii TaxID=1176176 RepID=UPI001EDCB757|nr:TIGR02281 family clan AA aspartic protease [Methylobacterium haplocladii]